MKATMRFPDIFVIQSTVKMNVRTRLERSVIVFLEFIARATRCEDVCNVNTKFDILTKCFAGIYEIQAYRYPYKKAIYSISLDEKK